MAQAMLSAPGSRSMRQLAQGNIGVPVLVLALLAMVVLPLPPLVLDVLFTFNIALSLVIVMAVFYVVRPLDFAVFPTILLLATLLRLALNVASTRVVLLHGHTARDAAGHVIQSFGEFVIGGNFAVGVVVFVILTIINFVVVTKGAGRISEVSARFTLDAMPGKQMAIDADLNAGLITQDEARASAARKCASEADFYGSMDGASKFVRGDAIAGILILFINIIGGLGIGMHRARPGCRRGGTHLHAADHRRRPRRADSGAAAVDRRRHHRDAHVARAGHGSAGDQTAVRPAARARRRGGAPADHGPGAGHAELRLLAAGGVCRAGRALYRSAARRAARMHRRRCESARRCRVAVGGPVAGTTWRRWT